MDGVEADAVEKAELILAINFKLKQELAELWGNSSLLGAPDVSGIDAETDSIIITPEKLKSEKQLLAERKALLQDSLHFLDDLADQSLDEAIRRSNVKQQLIQDEINASKDLTDTLREGARTGNAIASESLALQEKITEDKIRLKQKEAAKEKALAEAKAIFNIFVNALENGDNVAMSASKSLSAKAFFNALPTFFKGTKGKLGAERTADFAGQDGHIVRVDDGEMIFNGGQVGQLAGAGITTTQNAVESAVLYEQLSMGRGITGVGKELSTLVLEQEIKGLRADIKNKPEITLNPMFRDGMLVGVTQEIKRGSITDKYHKLAKRN